MLSFFNLFKVRSRSFKSISDNSIFLSKVIFLLEKLSKKNFILFTTISYFLLLIIIVNSSIFFSSFILKYSTICFINSFDLDSSFLPNSSFIFIKILLKCCSVKIIWIFDSCFSATHYCFGNKKDIFKIFLVNT